MTAASSVLLDETVGRPAVVKAALTWLRTPYHHGAGVKGAGVDCLYLVYHSYLEAGVIEPTDIPLYSHQWHLHRGDETYMNGILRYAREIVEVDAKPADLVLYKFGRTYSHGGLIGPAGWPQIIHASAEARHVLLDDGTSGRLASYPHKFFSMW